MKRTLRLSFVTLVLGAVLAVSAAAQSPQQFAPDAARYMALGDSIAAGYKAMPVTDGYVYLLYKDGVFDRVPHTLFNNISAVGATSADVLAYQVPLATLPDPYGLRPQYITLTVGGNDLLSILYCMKDPTCVPNLSTVVGRALTAYQANLYQILNTLHTQLPDAKIFVSNQYPMPQIEAMVPEATGIIATFNQITAGVVAGFAGDEVYLVDVHSAFLGRSNLVEGERGQTSPFEVHPTNVGHRVMEKAFADVIAATK
jgi:lysophospholipase L1-like esterase